MQFELFLNLTQANYFQIEQEKLYDLIQKYIQNKLWFGSGQRVFTPQKPPTSNFQVTSSLPSMKI